MNTRRREVEMMLGRYEAAMRADAFDYREYRQAAIEAEQDGPGELVPAADGSGELVRAADPSARETPPELGEAFRQAIAGIAEDKAEDQALLLLLAAQARALFELTWAGWPRPAEPAEPWMLLTCANGRPRRAALTDQGRSLSANPSNEPPGRPTAARWSPLVSPP
jgi:hypothetical protein